MVGRRLSQPFSDIEVRIFATGQRADERASILVEQSSFKTIERLTSTGSVELQRTILEAERVETCGDDNLRYQGGNQGTAFAYPRRTSIVGDSAGRIVGTVLYKTPTWI